MSIPRQPFVAFENLLAAVKDQHLSRWHDVERDVLRCIEAFDTEYSTGVHGTGWYQQKARYFNDLIVQLAENCSKRRIARRAKRNGTLFGKIDLDICYPPDSGHKPLLAGETKIAGTPPHPRNKNVARPGSSDIDKRAREVALTALDVKIAYAEPANQSILDVADWIRRTDPRYFSFWAFRAENATDAKRALSRLSRLNTSYCDGVGVLLYEPISPLQPTKYRLVDVYEGMQIGSVLDRVCRLVANSPLGS